MSPFSSPPRSWPPAKGPCGRCNRPPNFRQKFPDSYVAFALEQTRAHAGAWVSCGFDACAVDFGAGAGQMWAWGNHQGQVWHGPDCRAGRRPTPPAPAITRRCRHTECVIDEGYGPGAIADIGTRGRRVWHGRECEFAQQRLVRAATALSRPSTPCAFDRCAIDEGSGPGQLNPRSGAGTRRWHGRGCKTQADRLAAGLPALGDVIWAQCQHAGCSIDEGNGPGQIRNVVGAPGRHRTRHPA